ncbi:hypothetical protein FRC02_003164 [Tulasnella sp. 418]|nr:hypothetical protein FRC02_003164 [Tulasnella sp. 418]
MSTEQSGILRRRNEKQVVIRGITSVDLQDGDFVWLPGVAFGISAHWVPLNIFFTSRRERTKASRKLAKLGINALKNGRFPSHTL